MKIVFISVVRNKKMYDDLVRNNPYNQGAEFIGYDNTKENIYIPKRYNDFLDSYDYKTPAWFVFCHEDWQTKSNWFYQLKKLDKNSLYGICGTKITIRNKKYALKYILGEILGSNKYGNRKLLFGTKVKTGTVVDTFDCMCLIVHSSLIKKYHIRFDENLTWHLYTEEMCIRLKEEFNIPSRILQIQSQHWSHGKANEEFDKSFNYLIEKFKSIKNHYSCTVKNKTIPPINQSIEKLSRKTILTTYLSLFNIPVWKKIKYVDSLAERKIK